ncbi:hypothetical protein Mnod_3855 [Methylobacterium nodulans ORS 2060]|uniref:Uncharacterized protein n=2 Tax=Methylobacterium nodulans TaxID=114616 RepID=B8ISB5_METNO|nr:hypothetical protein Mnod_3855 [Methylobacterium nodulans ORS 2060]
MTSIHQRGFIKYLGSLRGRGHLIVQGHDQAPDAIAYQIDGFQDRACRSAAGQIEGDSTALAQAFKAGGALLTLEGGLQLDVVLSDPGGGPTAEVRVNGAFPL